MDSFTLPHDDDDTESHLLSQSSQHADLSLSDLSLGDRHNAPPISRFSLLSHPRPFRVQDESAIQDDDNEEHDKQQDDVFMNRTMTQEDIERQKREDAKAREERLQHDLLTLRKLNSAFEIYKDALRQTKSSTEHIAEQLEHTDALLNKYMDILAKSDKATQLILDERWSGAEADQAQLEEEYLAEVERRRREEEERRLAEERERQRKEQEERERREREEKAEAEREAAAKASSAKSTVVRGSGVRGVRGTRASAAAATRGTRGAATSSRGTAPATRGGSSIPTAATAPRGATTKRPSSSASARQSVGTSNPTATRAIPKRKVTRES